MALLPDELRRQIEILLASLIGNWRIIHARREVGEWVIEIADFEAKITGEISLPDEAEL